MVDVSDKAATQRLAIAEAVVRLRPETLGLVAENRAAKGDVLTVAKIAGIQAAKRTFELIPLAHPLALTSIELDFTLRPESNQIRIQGTVRCSGPTGVEMEALTAVSVAALTLYDMLKAADREMEIGGIRLLEKRGGRSGVYRRES